MALDSAAVLALANDLKAAKIACGAADNPALAALCIAEANAISTFVKKADVLPLPALASSTGPVTGVGSLA